ncbi:MAG: hypothetical protein JWN70_894 [Planctomycetaceae bacterium]|nr:hypothetical protein [Planctomycetaceae bacterium]
MIGAWDGVTGNSLLPVSTHLWYISYHDPTCNAILAEFRPTGSQSFNE